MPNGFPPFEETAVPGETSGARALTGGLWSGLRETLPQFYALIQSVIAARVLGPELMGRQSYIAWATLSIKVFVTGGIPVALIRSVGEWIGRGRPGVAARLVRLAWRIELGGAAVAGVVVVSVGLHEHSLRSAWLWAAVACLLAVLHGVPYAVLLGTQQFRRAAAIGLIQGGLATVATAAVLLGGGGVAGMFAVEAAAAALSLGATTVLARRALSVGREGPDRAVRTAFLRYASASSVLVVLELVVWKRSEFFFLGRYSSPVAIAQYSVAFALASAVARIPRGMASVVTPAVATLFGAGSHDRIRDGFGRSVRLISLVTFAVTAATVALGPGTLRVVYGNDYERSGTVLLILFVSFPFVPLATLGMALLQGLGQVARSIVATAAAAVVDLALAVALVPRYAEIGAAIANVGAQVVGGGLLLFFARQAVGRVDLGGRSFVGGVTASALAGMAAWFGDQLGGVAGLLVGASAGLLVFAAVGVPLRVLRSDDAEWLRDTAGSRLGGRVGLVAGRFVNATK